MCPSRLETLVCPEDLQKRLIAFLLKSCGWTLDADQALVVKLLVASSAAPIHAARREGTNCYRND